MYEGLTFDNGVEITELAPVCREGRIIYAASFDPAMGRPALPAASHPIPGSSPHSAIPHPSRSTETRLFFFGVAAGMIAALALGSHNGDA